MQNQNPKDLATVPCTALKGVGARVAEKLEKCAISNVQDLLFHLPRHYQDRTHIAPIGSLRVGDVAVIEGILEDVSVAKQRRPTLKLSLRDGSGAITLRFFHYTNSQKEGLVPGMRLRCFGETRHSRQGYEMIHPEYRRIFSSEPMPVEETLTPVYPTTEGLSQLTLRALTSQAMDLLTNGNNLKEYLSPDFRDRFALLPIHEAIQFVHRPPPDAACSELESGNHPAQKRLVFEELLAHHLSLRQLRHLAKQQLAPELPGDHDLLKQFVAQLKFTLTNAQQRVVQEIFADLISSSPMMRLVQGDVGSGKTVVAAMAMLQAVANGYQASLMAPTDLLAEQHFTTFNNWFNALGLNCVLLSGKLKGKTRAEVLDKIAQGEAHIIIGTHALFQEGVAFQKLGLVVIDEQHRFGVHQRLALREKGAQNGFYPHQLIMTATPIPRTLAMTLYADLDLSIIDELPPGRKPITTVVVPNEKRLQVIERIRKACLEKRQVYWVCTVIDESEVLQCQAAMVLQQQLIALLPEIRVGLVHGRLKPAEKEAVMRAFKEKELDLLVATTVVEVGVDVPNASLMIIENAERLGLAQLHQLRGRVGRGAAESFCVLLYQLPLSPMAKSRLQVMRASQDGFVIARKDLEIRGAGEMFGTRQTGALQFRIADLSRDYPMLPTIQQAAEILLRDNYPFIDLIIQRWLPRGDQFGAV